MRAGVARVRHQRGDAAVPDIEMIKGMNGLTLGGSHKTDYNASNFGNYCTFDFFFRRIKYFFVGTNARESHIDNK